MKSDEELAREYARMRVKNFNAWLAGWQASYDEARSGARRETLLREKEERYEQLRQDRATRRKRAERAGSAHDAARQGGAAS